MGANYMACSARAEMLADPPHRQEMNLKLRFVNGCAALIDLNCLIDEVARTDRFWYCLATDTTNRRFALASLSGLIDRPFNTAG
jgi:hypothetical protein